MDDQHHELKLQGTYKQYPTLQSNLSIEFTPVTINIDATGTLHE